VAGGSEADVEHIGKLYRHTHLLDNADVDQTKHKTLVKTPRDTVSRDFFGDLPDGGMNVGP